MNSGARLSRWYRDIRWLVAGLVEGGGEGEKRNRFHLIIEHYNRLAQLPPPFLHPSAVARNQPPVRDYAKVKVDRYPPIKLYQN